MAVVTIPERASGNTTLPRTPNVEQPSIRALSSTSKGISSMKDFSIQMANGTFKVKYKIGKIM